MRFNRWLRLLALCALALLPTCPHAAADNAPAKAKGPDYSDKDVSNKDFSGKNLENANFENADALRTNFTNCFAPGINFRGADLTGANLKGANFSGGDFRKAKLHAVIDTVDFSKCDLEGADFKFARMDQTSFRGANLRNAKGFYGCVNVDFRGADLRGADLTEWVNYSDATPCKFRGAKYSRTTRLPKQFFDPEKEELLLTADQPQEGEKESPKERPAGGEKAKAAKVGPGAPAGPKAAARDADDRLPMQPEDLAGNHPAVAAPAAQTTPARPASPTAPAAAKAARGPAGATRAALPPVPKGEVQLDGLYIAVEEIVTGGGHAYYFRPDGYVYQALPQEGLENLDWERAARDEPKVMSTYVIRGGKITVTTLAGDAQTTPYVAGRPGHFTWDGWEMAKVEPLPANTKLDGTYESTVRVGNSRQVWTYTFTADGRYTGSGGTSVRTAKRDDHYEGGFIGADVVATKPPAPGHYTISGTTLTVTNEAGETGRITIFMLPDTKQPPLFIGGLYCPRKK